VSATASISCDISSTDFSAELGLEIWLNNQQIWNCEHVCEAMQFRHEIPDGDEDHVLEFRLKNKLPEHTKIDSTGQIQADACVTVTNLQFDAIPLGQVFFDLATYQHDFNGTAPSTQEKFYGHMGCNGTVTLKFSTPIYMWMLENL
jgi:hypothetical protein